MEMGQPTPFRLAVGSARLLLGVLIASCLMELMVIGDDSEEHLLSQFITQTGLSSSGLCSMPHLLMNRTSMKAATLPPSSSRRARRVHCELVPAATNQPGSGQKGPFERYYYRMWIDQGTREITVNNAPLPLSTHLPSRHCPSQAGTCPPCRAHVKNGVPPGDLQVSVGLWWEGETGI